MSLGGLARCGGSTTYEFSTSNPMWRASLEILDFLPMTTVDYSGGIIITDWYSDISSSNEDSIKITVRFLSNDIRSDSLKIIVHKKKCIPQQPCVVEVLSKSANIFARKMTRSKLNDLTSGFRIYNASIFEKINLNHIHSEGYGFLVEVLNQINNEGFKIKEFPITFNDRERGKSKMSAKVIIDGVKNTIFIGIKNFGLKKYI